MLTVPFTQSRTLSVCEHIDMKAARTVKRIAFTSSLIKTLVKPEARAKVETITAKTAQKSKLYCQINETAALTNPYLASEDLSVFGMQKLAYLEVKQSPSHVLLSWTSRILCEPVVGHLSFPDVADRLITIWIMSPLGSLCGTKSTESET